MLIFATLATTLSTTNILFVGNSHTVNNDVPGLVRNLLVSDGTPRTVRTDTMTTASLNDGAQNGAIVDAIKSKKYQIVVLQGASISSSHKYKYEQGGGIALAKLAVKAGARTLLYAEWPRRGWDESAYIMQHYELISQPSGAEIVSIPYVADRAIGLNMNIWMGDGNHANLLGSYLAACTLYFWIAKPVNVGPDWRPKGLKAEDANSVRGFACDRYRIEFGIK
ncbi:MAG: hypothetical protein ABL949_00815 [Fimbriimonadaceae bacterium]